MRCFEPERATAIGNFIPLPFPSKKKSAPQTIQTTEFEFAPQEQKLENSFRCTHQHLQRGAKWFLKDVNSLSLTVQLAPRLVPVLACFRLSEKKETPISMFRGKLGALIFHMCQGLNSHYFHIIGDKLINPIVGVYIPIIRIPIKRWDDHPQ